MILNTTKDASETEQLPGLRKAAMLLIVLGEQASAELLQQLSEEDVQKVSREVAKITSISAEQAETVLNEFHHLSHGRRLRGARRHGFRAQAADAGLSRRTSPSAFWTA